MGNANCFSANVYNDATLFVPIDATEDGLWQNYGTGREVPRGNPGDIGRAKVRQKRPWFSRKFYASFMNLKEFMADSIGRQFVDMVSDALDADKMRRNNQFYNQ